MFLNMNFVDFNQSENNGLNKRYIVLEIIFTLLYTMFFFYNIIIQMYADKVHFIVKPICIKI